MVHELGPVKREDDDDSENTDTAEESDEETDTADEGEDEREGEGDEREGDEGVPSPSKGKQRVHLDSTDDQLWYRLSLLNVGQKKGDVSEGEDPLLDADQDGDYFQLAQETLDRVTGTAGGEDAATAKSTQDCDHSGDADPAESKPLSEAAGGRDSSREAIGHGGDEQGSSEESSDHSGKVCGTQRNATSITASTIDPRTRQSRIKYEREKAKQKAKEKRVKRKGKAGMVAKERRRNEETIRSYTTGAFF